jgi:hypothetical protein
MKRTFFTLFMMLLVSTAAFSQAQVGLRAGANWATLVRGQDYTAGVETPWRPGFTIGLASSFSTGGVFAIAPEINFSQRGGNTEGLNVNSERGYNFLELPVLFRISFGQLLKGYINAGPTFSYWLGGRADNEDINFSEIDQARRWEIGASLGGGVQLDTEVASFLIDLRYTRGFNELRDDLSGNAEFRNQLISVSLITLFPSVR